VNEVLQILTDLITFVFVLSTMLSIGLVLTIKQIINPLKNVRFVILSIVANFIIIPAIAYLIITFLPLDRPLQIGLILVACAAGAPALPKLAQIAKADVAASVGLMVLLIVITIIFLPLVLPLMLPGVEVGIWAIAQNLLLMMLLPLVIALFVRARWANIAEKLSKIFTRAANYSLIILIVLTIVVNFQYIINLFGSYGILASFIVVGFGFGAGYLLGGPATGTKRVLSLGTGQRNIAAAMIVALQNFDEAVLVMVIVFSVITLVVAVPLAGEFGRRSRRAS
jgi:BASS family bile acid:Na+ symporter